MDFSVFLLVLLAALLHASWNALIKSGTDRYAAVMVLSFGHLLCGLVALFFIDLPRQPEVWVLILLSATIHIAYKLSLARAYNLADFSLVYPMARGTAPLLTSFVAVFLLGDAMSPLGLLGVVLLAIGLIFLGLTAGQTTGFSNGPSSWLKGFFSINIKGQTQGLAAAFTVSIFIASYTLTDGLGGRLANSAHAYIFTLFIVDGLGSLLFFGLVYRRRSFDISTKDFAKGMLGGFVSMLAYWIVVWAMSVAPMGAVAALRETSVLAALFIALLFFGEKLIAQRVVAVLLIVIGAALLKFA